MAYYLRVNVFVIIIILFTSSLGSTAAQRINQDVLADSRIKKKSFKKKIMRDIKKSLPKNRRKCPITVTDVKVFRPDDDLSLAEEWTVDICQESKVYFIDDWNPKGVTYRVVPREERYAFEKETLRKFILWIDDEEFTKGIYYLEEILDDDEFKKWIAEDEDTQINYIEYTIDGVPSQHPIKVKNQ